MIYLPFTRVMLTQDYYSAGKEHKAGDVFTICCYDFDLNEYCLLLLGHIYDTSHVAYIPEKCLVKI